MKYWISGRIFLLAHVMVRLSPPGLLPRFAKILTTILGKQNKACQRARINIDTAFAEPLGTAACDKIYQDYLIYMGDMVAEYFYYSTRKPSIAIKDVEVHGWHFVEQARQQGHGVLMLGGHYGNFELQNIILGQMGSSKYNAYSGQQKNSYLGSVMNRMRRKYGIRPIPETADAPRTMIKLLKENQLLGIVADRIPKNSRTTAEFFGRIEPVADGMVTLAVKLECPVLFSWIVRHKCHRHQMHIVPLKYQTSGNLSADTTALAASYMTQLEKVIKQDPGQYLWHCRRN